MSDHQDTSEGRDLVLLDRADELAPTMSVDPASVLAAGRRRVRRRQATTAGVGALSLAGALWVGSGLLPTSDEALLPATVDWSDGQSVHVLDNAPHPSEAGRTHWRGELRSGPGDARPELVLTRDGVKLNPIAAEDGPGDVMIYRSGSLAVAVWASPAGSTGEWPLWNPGSEWGQGGDFDVDGATLWYASAEFVEGADPGLAELYWFSEDAGHAASGAPVESAVLTAGETRAVVMIDEARGVWGTSARATEMDGNVHIGDLVGGAGVTGWVPGLVVTTGNGDPAPEPAEVVPTTIGVLPRGASLIPTDSASTEKAQGTVAGHPVVLAADPARLNSAPPIRYAVGDEEFDLHSFVTAGASTLAVGGLDVQLTGTPDGLQLFVAPGRSEVVPNDALEEGGAVLTSVGDGQLLVVPGWGPANTDQVRVQVAGDWVAPDATYAGNLFDGAPFVALSLDDATTDGQTIQAVGTLEGTSVTALDLQDGVQPSDVRL